MSADENGSTQNYFRSVVKIRETGSCLLLMDREERELRNERLKTLIV